MFSAALTTVVVALAQQPEHWTFIGGCTNTPQRPFQFTTDNGSSWGNSVEQGMPDVLQQLSRIATKVKLCYSPQGTDCVESVPNTYPILNLRQGIFPLSHINGEQTANCGVGCVANFWTGSNFRKAQLVTRGGYSEDMFYHGSSNGGGLHVGRGLCTWQHNNRSAQEVVYAYINTYPTLPPTASPTLSPSTWSQNGEHFATLQALAASSAATQSQIQNLTLQIELLREMIQAQSTETAQLKQALQATVASVSANVESVSIPSVEAVARNVGINAPGTVSMTGNRGNCYVEDLCEVSSFAARLKDALRNFGS